MRYMLIALLVGCAAHVDPSSDAPAAPPVVTRQAINADGHGGFLLDPSPAAAGKPWVWYAPTLGVSLPDGNEDALFAELGAAGVAVAGIDVGESYGNAAGRTTFTALYADMIGRGYSARPCFLARSRGGLQALNWLADDTSRAACLAGIYPVSDITSYPGIDAAAKAWGMTADAFTAALPVENPIDRLASIDVPMYVIHGDADTVVPLEANSAELERRYRALGRDITLVVEPGHGHDMWPGFFRDPGMVDFLKAHAR